MALYLTEHRRCSTPKPSVAAQRRTLGHRYQKKETPTGFYHRAIKAMHQLQIPPAAEADPESREMARIWIANKRQHVSLPAPVWDNPELWGMMLVDLAKHVAKSYELNGRMSSSDALAAIKVGFSREWQFPTDEPLGELVD